MPAVPADRPADGAELIADLPLGDLADGQWQLGLTLSAAGKAKSAAPAPPCGPMAALSSSSRSLPCQPPVTARKSTLRGLVGKLRPAPSRGDAGVQPVGPAGIVVVLKPSVSLAFSANSLVKVVPRFTFEVA